MSNRPANFDVLARPYRWLEYLSFGPLLQRTRNRLLPALRAPRHALLLGDGDGRFTAALFQAHPGLLAEAVDSSLAMLTALRRRTSSPALTVTHADVRAYTPAFTPDLVVTHFVLDCLTQPEAEALIGRLTPLLATDGLWLVSEFRLPAGPLHWPARAYIRVLYFAFRLFTGLRVTRLPDYTTPMRQAGLQLVHERHALFGLLTSQLWRKPRGQSTRLQ